MVAPQEFHPCIDSFVASFIDSFSPCNVSSLIHSLLASFRLFTHLLPLPSQVERDLAQERSCGRAVLKDLEDSQSMINDNLKDEIHKLQGTVAWNAYEILAVMGHSLLPLAHSLARAHGTEFEMFMT